MANSTLYQKNIAALSQKDPGLAQKIEALKEIPGLQSFTTSKGEPNFSCQFGDGQKFNYYPTESPLNFSKDLVNNLTLKNPRVLIFLGVGLGHHLIEYAQKPHPLNQAMIIFEAFEPIFKKALETTDLTPLINSDRVVFCVGQDEMAARQLLYHFFAQVRWLVYANGVEYIQLDPAARLSANYFKKIQELLPQAIGHQFNRYFSDPYDSFIGLDNTLANLKRLTTMPAIDKLAGLFKDKPGVLIASGPSLAHSLPYLKSIQNNCIMAACPSALPLLLENDIHPHIWLNIERLENQGHFLKNLSKHPPHLFIGPPVAHPICFESNGGLNSYILTASGQSKWLPFEGEIFDLGHSSAHAVFLILKLLGCSSIYLTGQDLCYSDEGSHAAGVWDESQRMMKNVKDDGKIFELEGNNGNTVKANLFWVTFLKTFTEQLIPEYDGKVFHVIDAAMGVKITGTERIDPASLASHFDKENLDVMGEIEKKISDATTQTISINEIKDKLKHSIKTLDTLIRDSYTMAIETKKTQFNEDVIAKKWDNAKEVYGNFQKKCDAYLTRFQRHSDYQDYRTDYEDFFYPIIQGINLRYAIEFFSSGEDLNGDFGEITRKLEIIFHQIKDEAYWAMLVREKVEEAIKELD